MNSSVFIGRIFKFNDDKRQSIYEQNYIRSFIHMVFYNRVLV